MDRFTAINFNNGDRGLLWWSQCRKIQKEIKKDYRLRLTKSEHDLIKEIRVSNGGVVNNVLVIGDLHEPFCLDKYLEFCVSKYEQFDCTEVVFIGDCLDNHYSSYHETNADGMGGADELELSISRLKTGTPPRVNGLVDSSSIII